MVTGARRGGAYVRTRALTVRGVLALSAFLGAGAGCEGRDQFELRACTIEHARCRRDVFLAIEQLRGQLWDPWSEPAPVVVVTRDQYRTLLENTSETTPEKLAAGALGLTPPGTSVADADAAWRLANTEAYYHQSLEAVVFVGDERLTDPVAGPLLLAREYLHAAQDREFALGRFGTRTTTDWEVVRRAMVEGEAELYKQLAALQILGIAPDSFDWNQHVRSTLVAAREVLIESELPYAAARLSMPRALGASIFMSAWQQGGAAAAHRLFVDPPRTSLEVMLASRDRVPTGSFGAPSCEPPPPQAFNTFIAEDQLGALVLYAFLLHRFGLDRDAWEAALTWRGDRLRAFIDHQDRVLTIWSVRAPALRHTDLGRALVERQEPPILYGDELIFWSRDAPDIRASLPQTPGCDEP
jgi:hypothetical protein